MLQLCRAWIFGPRVAVFGPRICQFQAFWWKSSISCDFQNQISWGRQGSNSPSPSAEPRLIMARLSQHLPRSLGGKRTGRLGKRGPTCCRSASSAPSRRWGTHTTRPGAPGVCDRYVEHETTGFDQADAHSGQGEQICARL